jgi:hypothetical protein
MTRQQQEIDMNALMLRRRLLSVMREYRVSIKAQMSADNTSETYIAEFARLAFEDDIDSLVKHMRGDSFAWDKE